MIRISIIFFFCLLTINGFATNGIFYLIKSVDGVKDGRKLVKLYFINETLKDIRLVINSGQLLQMDNDTINEYQELTAYCLPPDYDSPSYDSVGQHPENNGAIYYFTVAPLKDLTIPLIFTCNNPGLRIPVGGQRVSLGKGNLINDVLYAESCMDTEDQIQIKMLSAMDTINFNWEDTVSFSRFGGSKIGNKNEGNIVYRKIFHQALKSKVWPSAPHDVDILMEKPPLKKLNIGDDGIISGEDLILPIDTKEFSVIITNIKSKIDPLNLTLSIKFVIKMIRIRHV